MSIAVSFDAVAGRPGEVSINQSNGESMVGALAAGAPSRMSAPLGNLAAGFWVGPVHEAILAMHLFPLSTSAN